jgi:alkaline phosphatase D
VATAVLGLVLGTAPVAAQERLLVATGDLTATSAVVWVWAPGSPRRLTLEYETAEHPAARHLVLVTSPGRAGTAAATLRPLRPGGLYRYRVRGDGLHATGEFSTPPPETEAARVTFVWSGDLGSASHCRRVDRGYRIFDAMAARRPAFFLFVGDTIYADHRCRGPGVVPGADFVADTLGGFRRKHLYNRRDPSLAAFLAQTPVSAIWDDHEVRNDFAGPVEPLMPLGRRAFLEFWPLEPPREEPTRLYRRLRWGRTLELFILDTRQYRSPNHVPDGPDKTMLGAVQRRWLVDGVATSSAVWKIVVSSVPLSIPTGRLARDSWSNASPWGVPEEGTGFATERDAIVRVWRERRVRNLVVLAADVHHAELIRHQPAPDFAFHEFVAGPLSASPGRPRPLDAGLHPQSLFARGGVNNFGEITADADRLTVRIVDEEGQVLVTHTLPAE